MFSSSILMVRPANFGMNRETQNSNAFQKDIAATDLEIKNGAIEEFDEMVNSIRNEGIEVVVMQDTETPIKPDAVFPNNWFTTHGDGVIRLYPMMSEVRGKERRNDLGEILEKNQYQVSTIKDYSHWEKKQQFLEGTGSIIFDHNSKMAFVCASDRSDEEIFQEVCASMDYKPVFFTAVDEMNIPIYHTNVMMCIGHEFCVICLESVKKEERQYIRETLEQLELEIIDITFDQMNRFAGNMLQLKNPEGTHVLIASNNAIQALDETQLSKIKTHTAIIGVSIPTIETIGGGSARCMMAEIFLPKKL